MEKLYNKWQHRTIMTLKDYPTLKDVIIPNNAADPPHNLNPPLPVEKINPLVANPNLENGESIFDGLLMLAGVAEEV